MKKTTLITATIATLAILAIAIVPVHTWVTTPPGASNPSGEDGNYESYGPHIGGILFPVYADATSELTAMFLHQIDLEDVALDSAFIDAWNSPSSNVTLANYGGEAGYFVLDINNNVTYGGGDTGASGPYDNPCRVLGMRQALAYMVSRIYIITTLLGGLGDPIWTPIPTYMSGYIDHDISPTGSLSSFTYGGLGGNLNTAASILDASGFLIENATTGGPDQGWRFWDKNGNGKYDPGEDLNLIFYSRTGTRGDFGDYFNNLLGSIPIMIKTTYHGHMTGSGVAGPVFANEVFQLYTGYMLNIGPDPDYLCDLYNGSNYYHPGNPPNYDGINYADLNANLTAVKLAPVPFVDAWGNPTHDAIMNSQICMAEHCCVVPLCSLSGVKAYSDVPVEADPANGNWTHLANQMSVGVDSWWSTLNMQQQNVLDTNDSVVYGLSSTITLENPVYVPESAMPEEYEPSLDVLSRIYDSGARRDPNTLATWVPQLYENWSVGNWTDPGSGQSKTYVNVTLRTDVYWQDGFPFTAADVLYTLVELSKDLLANGLQPPSWYPTVQYIRSAEMIDAYNLQILLDVNSVWGLSWVLDNIILPEHIWKPIVASANVYAFRPDSNIIGTGPFKWYSGEGTGDGAQVQLVANIPGAQDTYHNTTSPGYYEYDLDVDGFTIPEEDSYRITPSTITSYGTQFGHATSYGTPLPLNDSDSYVRLRTTLKNLAADARTAGIGLIIAGLIPEPTSKTLLVAGIVTLGVGWELDVVTDIILPAGKYKTVTVLPKCRPPNKYTITSFTTGDGKPGYLIQNAAGTKSMTVYLKDARTGELGYSTMGDWPTVTSDDGRELRAWDKIPADRGGTTVKATPDDLWITLPQDIAGSTLYDDIGWGNYTYKSELPAPDVTVNLKDVYACALAFGTGPGDARWNSGICDINHDYTVNLKDYYSICLKFGWSP